MNLIGSRFLKGPGNARSNTPQKLHSAAQHAGICHRVTRLSRYLGFGTGDDLGVHDLGVHSLSLWFGHLRTRLGTLLFGDLHDLQSAQGA